MSQEPFGDIPLFREIQKLLAGDGPVNTELARQVAMAIATGEGDPSISPRFATRYPVAVLEAQQLLSGYTRLSAEEPPTGQAITRAEWVSSTLSGWTWLIEKLSLRFSALATERAEGETGIQGIEAAMGQIVPLMMGLQAGTLIGHLAREALFRYELPIPRTDESRSFIVAANAEQIVSDYDFDADDLIDWVALRDIGRHLIVTAHPWVDNYFRSALLEVIESIEIDLGDLERRMMELQTKGMEGMEGLSPEDALPVVETARHRAALERLRSFFALFEGYASHAAAAVAKETIPTHVRIDEGMQRREAGSSEGRKALASVLGVSLDREVSTAGTTFCAAVVELKGIPALNRVWEAADNLPTLPEIRDPFAWMERVLDT